MAPSRRACPLGPGVGKAQVGSKKRFEKISVVADFCIEFFPRKVVNMLKNGVMKFVIAGAVVCRQPQRDEMRKGLKGEQLMPGTEPNDGRGK